MHDLEVTTRILGTLDREVWIVTSTDGVRRSGLVATWVSAASIDEDRPMLLAGLAPNHFTSELIDRSNRFAAHLMARRHARTALNFALGSGRERDKFSGLQLGASDIGPPVLEDCLAWLECKVVVRLDAGDRIFYWADVERSAELLREPPLRESGLMESASEDQLAELRRGRHRDLDRHRPLHAAWRENLPVSLRPLAGT